jgi:DNA-binding CsgD family transcriptional regulator
LPVVLSSSISSRAYIRRSPSRQVTLSDRQVETLTWAARGKTSAEIARIVGLTKRTVDFHIDNARFKLGAATRLETVIKALTGQLIKP